MNSTLKRTTYLLLMLVSMRCTYLMFTGDLQKNIIFTGTANEIAFTMIALLLSIGFAYLTVSKIEE
jgi:hypothetical protein